MNAPALRRATELPKRLKICARDRDGVPCLGVLYRPTPDSVYCFRYGSQGPGVVYVREETAR